MPYDFPVRHDPETDSLHICPQFTPDPIIEMHWHLYGGTLERFRPHQDICSECRCVADSYYLALEKR